MTTKLTELTANRDMLKEALKTEKKSLIENLQGILNEAFVEQFNGVITRCDISTGLWEETEIRFEVGFKNAEENRIDFGSNIDFEYTSRTKMLAINYGTIGYFSETDKYQFARLRMLGYVAENITDIQSQLADFLTKCTDYLKNQDEYNELNYQIDCINKSLIEERKVEIDKTITVDKTILEYREDIPKCTRIIPDKSWMDGFEWGVIKITPKFVTLMNLSSSAECKVRRDQLVNEIAKNNILIKNAGENT